jgi:hypothetical protein
MRRDVAFERFAEKDRFRLARLSEGVRPLVLSCLDRVSAPVTVDSKLGNPLARLGEGNVGERTEPHLAPLAAEPEAHDPGAAAELVTGLP